MRELYPQWQNAGDLMVAEIGGQSVIICRDESGKLQAFYNVCRHRGCRLFEKNGKIKKHIVCPYHGWGYSPTRGLYWHSFI